MYCLICLAGAAENTRVALHFANAAKRVTMQPHVNEVVNQKALLRKLRDEVALLRKQLVCRTLPQISACSHAPNRLYYTRVQVSARPHHTRLAIKLTVLLASVYQLHHCCTTSQNCQHRACCQHGQSCLA